MTQDKVLKYESPKLTAYGSVAALTSTAVTCTGVVIKLGVESSFVPVIDCDVV